MYIGLNTNDNKWEIFSQDPVKVYYESEKVVRLNDTNNTTNGTPLNIVPNSSSWIKSESTEEDTSSINIKKTNLIEITPNFKPQ